MSTIILIHGAWHGSWCWYKLIPLLESKGHRVIAPNLPSHGIDRTPIVDISLISYVNRIKKLLEKQVDPVTIVAHSMGGIVLSELAELYPDKIYKSVYLAAFLLQNKESLMSIAQLDRDSLILPKLKIDKSNMIATFLFNDIKDVFYHDCSEEDITLASLNLTPQALNPLNTPIKISNSKFEKVPRIYIETLQDKAISNVLQKQMYTKIQPDELISINSGHSPFFAEVELLAEHINRLCV